jgi:hypothetical protein
MYGLPVAMPRSVLPQRHSDDSPGSRERWRANRAEREAPGGEPDSIMRNPAKPGQQPGSGQPPEETEDQAGTGEGADPHAGGPEHPNRDLATRDDAERDLTDGNDTERELANGDHAGSELAEGEEAGSELAERENPQGLWADCQHAGRIWPCRDKTHACVTAVRGGKFTRDRRRLAAGEKNSPVSR